jgi:putative DNA methylase
MTDSIPQQRATPTERTQARLPFAPQPIVELRVPGKGGSRAIEDESFPFEALSDIAERESWRKEINRPLSHMHKWWAQRLGTVFRAILIATFAPADSNVLGLFHARTRVPEAVIFDPFMGSGTTIVEALKLGARAIGRDINPVAWSLVRNALTHHDRNEVMRTFATIEHDVAPVLRRYYLAELRNGKTAEVLYYFWVKTLACPTCARAIDLFGSYVFARDAYPKEHPEAQALCPSCGEINETRYDAKSLTCRSCRKTFDPQSGPAKGTRARCSCGHEFAIANAVKAGGRAPHHRLYAKLVLLPDGSKAYVRATRADDELYTAAEKELGMRPNAFPIVPIAPGYNTDQALGYNYRYWHEMFNARQLLALSILGERIMRVEEPALRELFVCLLSGTLEFNNMFTSYKGEGTGAVRHMFSHHIIKPERVPIEANLWGTRKSSGAFSTLFESRILRALDYAGNPFELGIVNRDGRKASEKLFDLSEPIGHVAARDFSAFAAGTDLYISCGDSGRTDLESHSVDAVVTDPPFFDNVHYSQLADFFHVWQRHFLGEVGPLAPATTRTPAEVQNTDPAAFTRRLCAVWTECHRVLKDDALLVFTYHHSRPEGWSSVLKALMDAGFLIVAAHPIKSEMSAATPKRQAKEPIDIDIVVVCRKRGARAIINPGGSLWPETLAAAASQAARLRGSGRYLSRNDLRVIVMAQLLRRLSQKDTSSAALSILADQCDQIEDAIEQLDRPSSGD